MERFTREEAERMGAFEETALDWEDVVKGVAFERERTAAKASQVDAEQCGPQTEQPIIEPLFITAEIEAEMIAAGYVFEPPPWILLPRR